MPVTKGPTKKQNATDRIRRRRQGRLRTRRTTLAENVTENVERIHHDDTIFLLRQPIDLEVRRGRSYIEVGYSPLRLHGYGRDLFEALESFVDQFWGVWKWLASADDSLLTRDARQVKRTMIRLVESVLPAA